MVEVILPLTKQQAAELYAALDVAIIHSPEDQVEKIKTLQSKLDAARWSAR